MKVFSLSPDGKIEIYPNVKFVSYGTGGIVTYKDRSKFKKTSTCQVNFDTYPFYTFLGERVIGQKYGSIDSVPLFGDKRVDDVGDEYGITLATHAYAEAYKTISGKHDMNWRLLLFILIAGACLIGLFYFFRSQSQETASIMSLLCA